MMIILLGVPGSGKSTQAELLVKRGNLRWISMGEVFRQKATEEQKKQMLEGKLIDSSEATELLDQELKELGDEPELILDGYPRYTDQAKWLLEQSSSGNLRISAVVFLYVDKEVVKKRMLLRGRMDDSEETINKRFDEFEKTSLPAIDELETGGVKVFKINADQTPEQILGDIIEALKMVDINA